MATSGGDGQGSVFTLRLPVVEVGEDGQRMPALSREEGGLEEAPRLDGVRVLVVEDEADARHPLAAVLQKRGARVFMAASGAEALEMLERERPDVLLSDIALQDQDGYERSARSAPSPLGAVDASRPPPHRPAGWKTACAPPPAFIHALPSRWSRRSSSRWWRAWAARRAMIEFTENGLSGRDPALARLFEREIADAGTAVAQATCRIEAEGADPQAPDRARIVLLAGEKVLEWTVALPAAPGDVSRATGAP